MTMMMMMMMMMLCYAFSGSKNQTFFHSPMNIAEMNVNKTNKVVVSNESEQPKISEPAIISCANERKKRRVGGKERVREDKRL
jgi:hypothetical protein